MSKIDLYYYRPSWTSCERTRAVLEADDVEVRTERSSRKEPLTDREARAMLERVGPRSRAA